MENTIVVGMGEALWDVLPEGKKIGGAPANFAYLIYISHRLIDIAQLKFALQ